MSILQLYHPPGLALRAKGGREVHNVCAHLLQDGQALSALKNGGVIPRNWVITTQWVPETGVLWKTPLGPVLRSATPQCMEVATRTKAQRNRGQHGLLNRQEAAAVLGVSVKTLDALTHSGQLRTLRMSKRVVRYWPQDLDKFVTGRSEKED
jgi:hypothetical protein